MWRINLWYTICGTCLSPSCMTIYLCVCCQFCQSIILRLDYWENCASQMASESVHVCIPGSGCVFLSIREAKQPALLVASGLHADLGGLVTGFFTMVLRWHVSALLSHTSAHFIQNHNTLLRVLCLADPKRLLVLHDVGQHRPTHEDHVLALWWILNADLKFLCGKKRQRESASASLCWGARNCHSLYSPCNTFWSQTLELEKCL